MHSAKVSDLVLLIDLDRTLYPPEAGLQEAGDVLLTQWVAEKLGIPVEEANALRRRLWDQYGTSARGLEVEYGIPQAEVYANSIERLAPADFVRPRPEVRRMLQALGAPSYVCSNTTARYCEGVLTALGLAECFAGIISIEKMNWVAKPHATAYQTALEFAGVQPQEVIFVDDALCNVVGARQVGWLAILCHPQPRQPWSPHIPDLLALPQALARLGLAIS